MSRRRRAAALASLALLCGVVSATLASRHRAGVEAGFGEGAPAVLVRADLSKGERFDEAAVDRSLEQAELPRRFLAPDALADPLEALGQRSAADVPAGSVLLASHLRSPRARSEQPKLEGGARPVQVRVSAAGSLAAGTRAARVDLVAALEPAAGGPRVRTIARRVPLLGLERAGSDEQTGARLWVATVGLSRRQALAAIEAENFAREVRLLTR